MRTSSTFSILFWVYTNRIKNNQVPLYARITVDGKQLNISLKRKIDVGLWNPIKQRAKGTTASAKEINQYLNRVYSELFQCHQDLRLANERITPQTVKSKYLAEDETYYTVRDIIEYHNTQMFDKLRGNTSRLYLTSQKYILLFIKKEYKQPDIELSKLDYAFILRFESFLRKHKPNHYQPHIGNNAVMKHIQRLRRMVTLAYQMEWIDRDPFIRFKQRLTKTNRGYLTAEELKRLEAATMPSKRLRSVRDMFLFSCYTGLAYCDLMELKDDHLITGRDGQPWIVTKRKKNENPVKIPLLPKPLALIEMYRVTIESVVNETLFPSISNQKMNSYLKEVAILVEISKNLTFHMARHTFATTIALSNGMPIETISKLLGHSKLTTTQIYAKVIEEKVSQDMNMLRAKLG
jgi:integrase